MKGMEHDFDRAWTDHHRRLLAIAHRMLRDHGLAEDAVQEAYLRFSRTPDVVEPGAWLSTTTARICLDLLKRASTRHERAGDADPLTPGDSVDPLEALVEAESVQAALGWLVGTLTPGQRISLLLHEVFDLDFAQIAAMTGRSAAATRQDASRARRRLAALGPTEPGAPVVQHHVVADFIRAAHSGDLQALVDTLDKQAWGRARFLTGAPAVLTRGALQVAESLTVFFEGALLVAEGTRVHAFASLNWFASLDLGLAEGRIESVDSVVDPRGARRTV